MYCICGSKSFSFIWEKKRSWGRKKWWMKVCVVFFFLMGKEWDSCNNISTAQHFALFFTCWFGHGREKKWKICFWLLFGSQREQNEKVPNNIRLFQKGNRSSILFWQQSLILFWKRRNAERGKDFATLRSQQAAKHFHETHFFFPLYSFFRTQKAKFEA